MVTGSCAVYSWLAQCLGQKLREERGKRAWRLVAPCLACLASKVVRGGLVVGVMADATHSVLGIATPFHPREIYVPVLALVFFFGFMIVVGQIVLRVAPALKAKRR